MDQDNSILISIIIAIVVFFVATGVIMGIKERSKTEEECSPYQRVIYNDDIVVCKTEKGYVIKERK